MASRKVCTFKLVITYVYITSCPQSETVGESKLMKTLKHDVT